MTYFGLIFLRKYVVIKRLSRKKTREHYILKLVRVITILKPIVCQKAFEAYRCYYFDTFFCETRKCFHTVCNGLKPVLKKIDLPIFIDSNYNVFVVGLSYVCCVSLLKGRKKFPFMFNRSLKNIHRQICGLVSKTDIFSFLEYQYL